VGKVFAAAVAAVATAAAAAAGVDGVAAECTTVVPIDPARGAFARLANVGSLRWSSERRKKSRMGLDCCGLCAVCGAAFASRQMRSTEARRSLKRWRLASDAAVVAAVEEASSEQSAGEVVRRRPPAPTATAAALAVKQVRPTRENIPNAVREHNEATTNSSTTILSSFLFSSSFLSVD
jgi:hypothetical protein